MRKLAALFAMVFALLVCAPGAWAQEVFDRGHVDAFYLTTDSGVHLGVKEDVTGSGVKREAQDVVLKVNQSAYSQATEGVDGIGQATYFLPQTQQADLLWPGWDTQQVEGAVDFHFDEVSGPGEVFVFETAGFGDVNAVANTGLALSTGSIITQPYPAHRHVNWAFTQPGTYTMTVRATSAQGESNAATYTWHVGDGEAPQQERDDAPQAEEPQHADAPAAEPAQETVVQGASEEAVKQAPTQLADTGPSVMVASIAILGLGLLVLGLGFARI